MHEGRYPPLHEMTEVQLEEALKDPHWRLRNLYKIKDKDGDTVTFKPNEVQDRFIDRLWYRNLVPKARQRGFSTAVQIIMLDRCLFVPLSDTAVIAQDKDTAKKIRNSKIKFAYDRLPPVIRHEMVPLVVDNVTELRWDNGSVMTVSASARGGTLDFLHVSEYGIKCLRDPEGAREIQEGSFPAAEKGIIVVESTVESNYGIFADMVRQAQAQELSGRKLSRLDFRLHFASWWDAAEYEIDPELVAISPQDHAYFARMETTIGREIGPRKRAWYVAKRDSEYGGANEKMWRQYPTTLEEAFQVATDGLWLAEQLARARREGRITRVPLNAGLPVNTFWDIGTDDDTAIWLHQQVGPRDHWVGFIEGASEPPSYYVRALNEWAGHRGAAFGTHYLPHDADRRLPGGEHLKTYADQLNDLGLRNIEIVARTPDVTQAIDQLREDFTNYWLDEEACKAGIAHLDGFSKVWNGRLEAWSPQIAKNGHQHAADALRQKAQIAHILRASSGWKRKRKTGAMGV